MENKQKIHLQKLYKLNEYKLFKKECNEGVIEAKELEIDELKRRIELNNKEINELKGHIEIQNKEAEYLRDETHKKNNLLKSEQALRNHMIEEQTIEFKN